MRLAFALTELIRFDFFHNWDSRPIYIQTAFYLQAAQGTEFEVTLGFLSDFEKKLDLNTSQCLEFQEANALKPNLPFMSWCLSRDRSQKIEAPKQPLENL